MNVDDLKKSFQEKIASAIEAAMTDVLAKSAEKPATVAPTVELTSVQGLTAEDVNAAVEKAVTALKTEIDTLKTELTKKAEQPVTPPTPDVATSDIKELTKKYAAEHGLDPESIEISVKETKKSVANPDEPDQHQQKVDGKGSENSETLEEQVSKATPEERKAAVGVAFRSAMKLS